MQRPIPSRKRAAPGADPIVQQPDLTYAVPQQPQPLNNQLDPQFDWSQVPDYTQYTGTDPSYNVAGYDNTGFNGAVGAGNVAPLGPEQSPQNAGQLVRRNVNQQLARQSRLPWESTGVNPQTQPAAWEMDEDEAELEQRALDAKKEAQAKRKQIPPFVQKLSR
jgi:heat shock transcription factor